MGPITSPRDLLRILRRRALLILLVLLIGLPASVWFALHQPRVYEATAMIQIEAPQVAETLVGQTAGGVSADSQLDLIQQKTLSRDNMVALIDRFDLFAAEPLLGERVDLLRDAVSIIKLVDPDQAWRPDVQPSGLMIRVRLGEAQRAADVANALLDGILAEAQRRSEGRAARTLEFLVAEEARVGAEMAGLEARFARFKEENSASLPDAIADERAQLARLAESRIALDRQLIELQTGSDRLRADEVERQTTLIAQQSGLIAANIAAIEAALAAAPEVERQTSAFERELTQLQDEFSVITTRRTEAAMTQLLESQDQATRFEVLETAIAPDYPISASRKKIAMAGGVLTGLLALALAIGLEMANSTIRTAAQLERLLGVQPVAVIPRLRRRRGPGPWGRGALLAIVAILAGIGALLWSALLRIADHLPGLSARQQVVVPVHPRR